MVDENQQNGQFVLTGSNQLGVHQGVTQSLAGRTAIVHLFPLSVDELAGAGIVFDTPEEYLYHGFLPRLHDKSQRPQQVYANYHQTYVERDVRQLINLKNYVLFEKFMRLLAGRVGQIINYDSLAGDVGVNKKTVQEWLSILEVSFVVFRLSPYFENFGKRAVKSPKYYFVEPGLLVYLLGISQARQISRDPLVGAMFENLVICEFMKQQANRGLRPDLYFYRDRNQNEVDLLFKDRGELVAVEIKAAATYRKDLLTGIRRIKKIAPRVKRAYLIYAGENFQFSDGTTALRYDKVAQVF